MKLYLLDIFSKIQLFSEKLDNIILLTNQHWVLIDEITTTKTVYIFRSSNELLIVRNGNVEKAKWEYLGNKSLLIDMVSGCYLFKHGFFDQNCLALKIDSSDKYAVFVNESKYEGELNTISKVADFLQEKYINFKIDTSGEPILNNIVSYIENIQIVYREIIGNITLKIVSTDDKTIGASVFIDNEPANNGIYVYKSLTHKLIVHNGKITERFFLEIIKKNIFEKSNNYEPAIGDKIYTLDWESVPNGKYKYSIFKKYLVNEGVIVR